MDGRQAMREGHARWARFRATVATLAATGIVIVCLSYRDQEANHLGSVPRNGAFFASLSPLEDTVDSPNGVQGFELLQRSGPASVALVSTAHGATHVASTHVVVADGLKFKSQSHQTDFLSAGAARSQMQLYWKSLAQKTKLEDGGDAQVADVSARQPEGGRGHGDAPLTAGEARRQLEDYWKDLGSHDNVRSVRIVQRKMEAAARLAKKAKKAVDVVKDTSMDEMERIWSSESRSSTAGKLVSAKTAAVVEKSRAPETNGRKHQHATSKKPAAPSVTHVAHSEASGADHARRYTSLPMCDRCSRRHVTWPVWNHRVDHALRVAENIAQGSHWNSTLHHVTVPAPGAEDEGDAPSQAYASDKDLELEVESAMSTLRAAIAESKAEQVEQEAQEHGPTSTSLATAQRTQCLTACYTEVHSLVLRLAPQKNDALTASATSAGVGSSARGAAEAVSTPRAPVEEHPKLSARRGKPAPVPAPASADSGLGLGDGDSIEKAVDAVEEAVGDSEAAAGQSGGNGVAAAVGAVEEAVAKDVGASDSAKSSASDHKGVGVAKGASAAKDVGALDGVQEGKPSHARVVAGGGPAGKSGAAEGAKEVTDVRKLEDSALNDAAEAQEQVRQGESELKHLKSLLATAHQLNSQSQHSETSNNSGDGASGDEADGGVLPGDLADSEADLGASSPSETLALQKRPTISTPH